MFFKKKKRPGGDGADRLAHLCGKTVKYVSRRSGASPGEAVIGREGFINLFEGRIVICCGNDVVFDMPLAELSVGELMSKNGATFAYSDEDGQKATVIAYYSAL